MRPIRIFFALMVVAWLSPVVLSENNDVSIFGFHPAHVAAQQELERHYNQLEKPEHYREWMKKLSAHPHHASSPYGKENAEFMAELFRSWGYETRVETFPVLFPTPKIRKLELISPERNAAQLKEPAIQQTWKPSEQLQTYNAYSIDGDVTAELVYVNYGTPEDYKELKSQGVDVKGRIVIARYGQIWRGVKPKVAFEHGAIGCIIYSDPQLDGYSQGDVYPKGAYRPEQSVQLGSVLDLTAYPGDPLTPFKGSTPDTKRLSRDQAASLTKIPVLPISYGDALPLLKAMGGPVAPEAWRGTLPVTYHLGPGPAKVHLELLFDWNTVPVYDVIAILKGSEIPDEWIIHGNHHDAWIAGATDPGSAMAVLLEEARATAELVKNGNPPRRTIVFAAWDAEEPGFIGSTEWAETNAEELKQKTVVYLNTDSNARGFLQLSGSFTLQRFLNEVARDVIDPQSKVSVLKRALAQIEVEGAPPAEPTVSRDLKKKNDASNSLQMEPLGSGSDFTAFLDHLGIASMDFSYCCDSDYGVYHSAYDSFEHYERFVDPKFEYETTLFQTSGRTMLRLANADILPFDFVTFSERIDSIVQEMRTKTDQMRAETERRNEWIKKDLYKIIADNRKPFVPPQPEKAVPMMNFDLLKSACDRMKKSAALYNQAFNRISLRSKPVPSEELKNLNQILINSERALTRQEGLPGRSWYRHFIYGPGTYTGYSAKMLPGLADAIDQQDFETAQNQLRIAAEVLDHFTEQIERATKVMESALTQRL